MHLMLLIRGASTGGARSLGAALAQRGRGA